MTFTTRSEHACHGGRMGFYEHQSDAIGLPMRFSVFVPGARSGPLPALYFLAGLTCTEETFAIKAGAQRLAYENGLILVMPDTSPRGAGIPGEDEDWDFGTGAGFYLNATAEPWSRNYRMAEYVSRELPALIEAGSTRDDAYRLVQRLAQQAWDQRTPFRELLAAEQTAIDLDALFDYDAYLAHVPAVLERLDTLDG